MHFTILLIDGKKRLIMEIEILRLWLVCRRGLYIAYQQTGAGQLPILRLCWYVVRPSAWHTNKWVEKKLFPFDIFQPFKQIFMPLLV